MSHGNETKKVALRLSVSVKQKKSKHWLIFFEKTKKINEFVSSWKYSHSASQKNQNWALIFKHLTYLMGMKPKKLCLDSVFPSKTKKNHWWLFVEKKKTNFYLVENTFIRLVRKIKIEPYFWKILHISWRMKLKKLCLDSVSLSKTKKNNHWLLFVEKKKS